MIPPREVSHAIAVAIVLVLALASGLPVFAADAPAWKFEPGQVNRYRLTQDVNTTMDMGAGGQAETKLHQVIDTSWTVEKLNDDGSAQLKQKIERMRMTVTAGGQETAIDSSSKEPPQGQAALLAPLVKAMTVDSFTVTMAPRGKIETVEVPKTIVDALANSPGANLMGEMATEEGFKKMVSQSAFTMPQTLEPGHEWTTSVDTKLPMIGKQTAETTYRYEGPKDVDGKTLEAFKPTLVLKYAGGEATVDVAGQESDGEILFNGQQGRLESMRLKHGVDLSIKVGPQTIEQKIDQSIEMKWMEKFVDEEEQKSDR